jgi:hypothetical protein
MPIYTIKFYFQPEEDESYLDSGNPKGWGLSDDESLPSEHGKILTDKDIENIVQNISNVEFRSVPGYSSRHTCFIKNRPGNRDTVIVFPGGSGRLYALNSASLPSGLVFPTNLLHFWPDDVNLVVMDLRHGLDWNWYNYNSPRLRNISDNKHNDILVQTKLTAQPFNYKLLVAFRDIKSIIGYINETLGNTKIWLTGHCTSSDLISRFYDFIDDKSIIDGMIFTNPIWKHDWKEKLDKMKYFHTEVRVPLMAIQHRDDKNKSTASDIARKILVDSKSPITEFTELSGGVDQGCGHFSMGYHGFREIEPQLVSSMIRFIKQSKR